MQDDHRAVWLRDGLLTRFTDYPPRPLVFALGVALQDGLSPFGGSAAVVVGRIALDFKTSMRSRIDAAGLMDCCRCRADGQTTDQNGGERGGDGAFAKFHGVSAE